LRKDKAPHVIISPKRAGLDRKIQDPGKAKGICFWMPRIYQSQADKPGHDKEVQIKAHCGKLKIMNKINHISQSFPCALRFAPLVPP
jgi:hypothetical protein